MMAPIEMAPIRMSPLRSSREFFNLVLELKLTQAEKADLVAFLRVL
jgi:hypothetical protein